MNFPRIAPVPLSRRLRGQGFITLVQGAVVCVILATGFSLQAQEIKMKRIPRTNNMHAADLLLVDSWLGSGSNYSTRSMSASNIIPGLALVNSNSLTAALLTKISVQSGTGNNNTFTNPTTVGLLTMAGGTNSGNFTNGGNLYVKGGTIGVGTTAISDSGGNLLVQGLLLDTTWSSTSDGTNGGNMYVKSNLWFDLTTLNVSTAPTNFIADLFVAETLIRLTNNLFFQLSTNRQASKVAYASVTIESGNTNWNLAFNSNWKWLGTTNNPPTSIASNKVAVIALKSYGSSETNIIAAYAVQP